MQAESPQPDAWPPLPERPELAAGELHLCRFGIGHPEPGETERALLSVDERERLDRTRNPAAAREFFAGRVALRRILGCYLNRPPGALAFRYSESGKPELAEPGATDEQARPAAARVLQFNLSHTGRLGLVAVTWDEPVGVDVESLERELDWEPIAKRYLATAEHAAICACPAENRPRAFLEIWVRREALAKAGGQGLARTLGPMRAGNPPDNPREGENWVCRPVNAGPNLLVCVASQTPKRLRCYDFRVDIEKK